MNINRLAYKDLIRLTRLFYFRSNKSYALSEVNYN